MPILLAFEGVMTQLQQAQELMESAQSLNSLTTTALIGLALLSFIFFLAFLTLVIRQVGGRGKADDQQQSDVIKLATNIESRTEKADERFFAYMEKQVEASNRVALALEASNLWGNALKTGVNTNTGAVQQVTEQTRLMKLAIDQMAANLKTLSDGLDNLPEVVAEATAAMISEPLTQLQEQVMAAVQMVNAEKKLQTGEQPAVPPLPETLPEDAPVSTTTPPEAATVLLTQPEVKG